MANKNYGGSGGVAKQENTLDVDNDGMKLSLENTTFFLSPLFYPRCFFLFFFLSKLGVLISLPTANGPTTNFLKL